MAKSNGYQWAFKPRFRRHAFGWKSQPAIARVKAAVSEIRQVARTDATLAAGGAVLFLEKVSGALEHVDSSSGAIGTAVGHAVSELAAVIAAAPAAPATRAAWLERLFDAHADDQKPQEVMASPAKVVDVEAAMFVLEKRLRPDAEAQYLSPGSSTPGTACWTYNKRAAWSMTLDEAIAAMEALSLPADILKIAEAA